MKTEFLLVSSIEMVAFQDRVNKLLAKGYQILGTPFSHDKFLCMGMYIQTEEYYPPTENAAAPEGQ